MDKHEIYLSSPIITLEDLRSEIIHYLENEKDFKVISYGDICKGRLSGEPGKVDQCLSGVRQSSALFLVIARRYGKPNYPSNGKKVSMTELEYLEAVKHGIKRFVFCREEVWTIYGFWKSNPDIKFDRERDPRYDHPQKLMNFVSRIDDEDITVDRFRDVRELKDRLSGMILEVIKDKPKIVSEDKEMEVKTYGEV